MAESEEELKRLLTKMKEESEKASLKLKIQKTKIMAPGPITSWQIDGETVESVRDFIFGGSKITADVDCSHKVSATVFPVVMYGCESWTLKKAEHWTTDASALWC